MHATIKIASDMALSVWLESTMEHHFFCIILLLSLTALLLSSPPFSGSPIYMTFKLPPMILSSFTYNSGWLLVLTAQMLLTPIFGASIGVCSTIYPLGSLLISRSNFSICWSFPFTCRDTGTCTLWPASPIISLYCWKIGSWLYTKGDHIGNNPTGVHWKHLVSLNELFWKEPMVYDRCFFASFVLV